ncbi:DciA family protein [Thioalkalivibrio sp. HK1]|uniref:DciA family protein n=1 Tax=Thioalkalivibrio sp. HK1 TaxID=1469245 RepID=UPI0004AD293A|nr:DciA family protein [Thioalkalivibrio sp. HK1]
MPINRQRPSNASWKSVHSIIDDGLSEPGKLLRRAKEYERLDTLLAQSIASEMKDGPDSIGTIRLREIKGDRLLVSVDCAAGALRLRFLNPQAIARIARALGEPAIRRIEIRVRPDILPREERSAREAR